MSVAVLAAEAVAKEDVEPGEGGVRARLDERLQRHHARKLDLKARAVHCAVVVLDDVDAIEKHRLDRVLPRPERQWIVTQRPEIRVQHQYRPTALRDMCVQVTLPASIYAAKQHELTYYMQRDWVVKSSEGLIQQGPSAFPAPPGPTCGKKVIRREHAQRAEDRRDPAGSCVGRDCRCADLAVAPGHGDRAVPGGWRHRHADPLPRRADAADSRTSDRDRKRRGRRRQPWRRPRGALARRRLHAFYRNLDHTYADRRALYVAIRPVEGSGTGDPDRQR